ncbi:MAG: hypothetical protein FH748_04345 [Balneolaceae bacterium]|nr:hypothetical protein [Balneolaceae bacterium]
MKKSVILYCFLLASCSLFSNDPRLDPNIIGDWEWERSVGGIGGNAIDADSVDYSQQLEVMASGDAFWYKDGIVKHVFKVERGDWEIYDGLFVMIAIDTTTNEPITDGIVRVIEMATRRTMMIAEECADCYTHTFIAAE